MFRCRTPRDATRGLGQSSKPTGCARWGGLHFSPPASGARPGARRESLEAYAQRISKLEELANSFEGVAKTYALSAGREIRVMILPEKLSDVETKLLASDIARKIKETMEYPGQIKVTVIRQTVESSFTDEFLPGHHQNKKESAHQTTT